MYKHMVVAYDGSPLSDKALDEAIEFGKQTGCKISLLYVLTPHHLLVGGGRSIPGLKELERQHAESLRQHAREMLQSAQERIVGAGIACEVVLEEGNHPYQHIVDGAKRLKCDVVVMASHGRRGIEGLVVGSQTVKVLTHSSVPVLVVR
jgi:nucleotide-binding universal stress UspA family protein